MKGHRVSEHRSGSVYPTRTETQSCDETAPERDPGAIRRVFHAGKTRIASYDSGGRTVRERETGDAWDPEARLRRRRYRLGSQENPRDMSVPVAIESSSRMRTQVKPRTSTRNPVIRYLFVVISFILRNLWMVVLWSRFSPVKPGPRTIEMCAFRFDLFQLMIWEAVRSTLKIVRNIHALRNPG